MWEKVRFRRSPCKGFTFVDTKRHKFVSLGMEQCAESTSASTSRCTNVDSTQRFSRPFQIPCLSPDSALKSIEMQTACTVARTSASSFFSESVSPADRVRCRIEDSPRSVVTSDMYRKSLFEKLLSTDRGDWCVWRTDLFLIDFQPALIHTVCQLCNSRGRECKMFISY